MEYLIVKWLHVLSSTVLFGAGIGSAFYLFMASRDGSPASAAYVSARVVQADWLFTAPTALIQPLTGLWLVHRTGMPWSLAWITWSIVLYALAIACWLPVIWMQIRMRDLARAAAAAGAATLPPAYRRLFHAWVALGAVAFVAFLAIFWLMVAKPA